MTIYVNLVGEKVTKFCEIFLPTFFLADVFNR